MPSLRQFIFVLCLLSCCLYSYQYELSVCAIFQNEAPYLQEWIEHHRKNGVEHFWLYNNRSTDNYEVVLKDYIEEGIIEMIQWEPEHQNVVEWNVIQCNAYKDAIRRAKKISRWCAFLDTDEFLFCPDGRLISKVLKAYKSCGGVGVNWVMYGCSQIEKLLPGEKMLDCLVYRSPLDHPDNRHIKTITQPHLVKDCVNPHYFLYKKKKHLTVDENFSPIEGPFSNQNSVHLFRINHYWSRDLDFFLNHKILRQKKWWNNEQQAFEMERKFNQIYDPILAHKNKIDFE